MNLIDVTLRDGGHQVQFNWPDFFAISHLKQLLKCKAVNYIELGYWKQTAKSTNKFYNMNEKDLDFFASHVGSDLFARSSIMVDAHYCSHDPKDYPDSKEFGVGLVRICSRSEDIYKAVSLGEKIKARTGSKISMNFFNITNYTESKLTECVELASKIGADFIYFADTHGSLDLMHESDKYRDLASMINSYGITAGFHLRHSGKAYELSPPFSIGLWILRCFSIWDGKG